jgi:hypothetical protein
VQLGRRRIFLRSWSNGSRIMYDLVGMGWLLGDV